MNEKDLEIYTKISGGILGFYRQKRGLIAVWGKESAQFLNGLITNDVAKLEENASMFAAFPNAQGRLLAVVRVYKSGGKFLFETEAATREKVYNNLLRFTFAGDFFVEDLSENYNFFSISDSKFQIPNSIEFQSRFGKDVFISNENADNFLDDLKARNAVEINDAVYEVLRIEKGIPLYGTDMDETTIVPELGIEGLISYNKGCYIGQEIIARIYFRGHVAKQLRGLVFNENPETNRSEPSAVAGGLNLENPELKSPEGKNAGKITSVTFSPKLGKTIALGYARYEFLADDTELKINDLSAKVKTLPFV